MGGFKKITRMAANERSSHFFFFLRAPGANRKKFPDEGKQKKICLAWPLRTFFILKLFV